MRGAQDSHFLATLRLGGPHRGGGLRKDTEGSLGRRPLPNQQRLSEGLRDSESERPGSLTAELSDDKPKRISELMDQVHQGELNGGTAAWPSESPAPQAEAPKA